MSGTQTDEEKVQYLRAIFDTIPLPAFIVDDEARIHDFNTAAEAFLGPEAPMALYQRSGDVFHCLNAAPRGCGNAEACQNCLIRNSIARAIQGQATYQEMHNAMLITPKGSRAIDLLVTASLLPYTESVRVLLILEDVTEISTLRGIVSGSTPTRTGTA